VIVQLRGVLIRKEMNSIVLDVQGVGYSVQTPIETLNNLELGSELVLQITQVFKEDAVSLFGFSSLEEREIFEVLCSVNGVGPKSALAILNRLGVEGVQRAVVEADDVMFKAVSGIGPKTAKLIVLSLTGKLVVDGTGQISKKEANVLAALTHLGFQQKASQELIGSLTPEQRSQSESELLKIALGMLAKSRRIESDD